MHVIWKRPDGFHNSLPSDYRVVELEGHSRLWLHKNDKDTFPFRISGGWEEEKGTIKLNNLVNLLGQPEAIWIAFLGKEYANSNAEDSKTYLKEVSNWLSELTHHLKGDSWEIDIMKQAIEETRLQVSAFKDDSLKSL